MHLSAAEYVSPLDIHSSTSNLGFSNLYEMYSSVAFSLISSIGKILLNTLSKPFVKCFSIFSLNSVSSLYEFFWTSIKFGIDKLSLSLPKLLLMFFFFSKR